MCEMNKNTATAQPILKKSNEGMKTMYSNESYTQKSKNTKSNSVLTETLLAAEKCKTQNPPGVSMPPEKEMSPAQLG